MEAAASNVIIRWGQTKTDIFIRNRDSKAVVLRKIHSKLPHLPTEPIAFARVCQSGNIEIVCYLTDENWSLLRENEEYEIILYTPCVFIQLIDAFRYLLSTGTRIKVG